MKKKILSALLALAMGVSIISPIKVEATVTSTKVETMVNDMSLRDKITQMLMVDFRYWDEDTTDNVAKIGFEVMNEQVKKIVEDYNFGALIYFAQNLTGTEQSYNLTMAMQEAATKDGGIPMLISADQEGGSVYRLGTGTALPGNMALGATANTEYSRIAGEIIGSELSVLGINTNLAPVVDVNNNANNPVIGLRSYSDDATIVGEMASATIEGMAKYNVIGCAKHFPGHGDTATDSHYGLPSVDKSYEELVENELAPYYIAIEDGIEMIMTAHILYPQLESDTIVSNKTGNAESLPATMSDDIITGLLKEEMGFEGIVVTDAMNMAGIADKWDEVQSVIIAIQSGVDMICMPTTLYSLDDLKNLDAIIDGVEEAVLNETIPMERIDDAVTRILTVKENRGILDYNAADYTLEKALATVGSDENRELEREIAAAAVTVVKNENNTLPLNITSESKVLMMVPYNNEKAQMIMAWNRAVEAGLIPEGAEVDVVRFSSESLDATAETKEDGTIVTIKEKIDWADTIIINSEVSKANRMEYDHWLSAAPNAFVNYAEENNKTTVVQSVDKPYDVQLYPNADAILAVYGCKGSAVDPTEAIVGGVTGSEAAYGPNIIAGVEVALGVFGAQGTLPVNIQKFDNTTDTYTDEILYARGFGIKYDALTDADTDTDGDTGEEDGQPENKPEDGESADKPSQDGSENTPEEDGTENAPEEDGTENAPEEDGTENAPEEDGSENTPEEDKPAFNNDVVELLSGNGEIDSPFEFIVKDSVTLSQLNKFLTEFKGLNPVIISTTKDGDYTVYKFQLDKKLKMRNVDNKVYVTVKVKNSQSELVNVFDNFVKEISSSVVNPETQKPQSPNTNTESKPNNNDVIKDEINSSTNNNNVNTGDTSTMVGYILLGATSLLGAVGLTKKRNKK